MVCFHGNSSTAETFGELIDRTKRDDIQVIAPDLPGCGRSVRLDEYSMEIVGQLMRRFILSFDPSIVYLFGHSLGGHLTAFIDIPQVKGIALAGTPPLSSNDDFPNAFTPGDEEIKLIHLLMKDTAFTTDEAIKFVSHTGVTGPTLELMIEFAGKTDGQFRKGCLGTVANVNQKEKIESMKNVVIFHAMEDGVISPDYLEGIDKDCLFEHKIHYVEGKHMSPILQVNIIVST